MAYCVAPVGGVLIFVRRLYGPRVVWHGTLLGVLSTGASARKRVSASSESSNLHTNMHCIYIMFYVGK